MPKDELKSLPAEERIKKLKEIERQKKKEIEEAHKLLQESEEELTEQQKWKEKVPIPEVAKEELGELSEEGKELLKVHKGLESKSSAKTGEESEEKEKANPRRKSESLEETVAREKRDLPLEAIGMEYGPKRESAFGMQYGTLSEKPIGELYQEAMMLRESIDTKGYVSQADERRAEYLTGVVQERLKAAEGGEYSFSRETARAASLTMRLGEEVQNMYQRKKDSSVEHDWYKGR